MITLAGLMSVEHLSFHLVDLVQELSLSLLHFTQLGGRSGRVLIFRCTLPVIVLLVEPRHSRLRTAWVLRRVRTVKGRVLGRASCRGVRLTSLLLD